MPTPESEEIVKAIWQETSDFICGDAMMPDALHMVQAHAPRIDALVLRRITETETSWREALRLERRARAKAEADQKRYHLMRSREMAKHGFSDVEIWDAGIDSAIAWGQP